MPGFNICVSTLYDSAQRRISQNVSPSLSDARLCCILYCYSILSDNISVDGTVRYSTAMARDVEESSHRTAFNGIHFMALKRTTKQSQNQAV